MIGGKTLTIPVTKAEIERLRRVIHGNGGWQQVNRLLLEGLNAVDGTLTVDVSTARRVIGYTKGQGGYQDRFRGPAEKLLPLLPPVAETGSLF